MIRFFVDNWRFSFLLTALMLILGVLGLNLLQRESFPPVNFATLTVVSIYAGASPEEVQDRVTRPIEDELRGISGIKDVLSVSQSGRSQITVRIDIDRDDVRNVVNEVQRAVTRAGGRLPPEVIDAPIVTEVKAKEIPIVELAIIGNNQNRGRDLLAENLKESIEDVRGVSSVRYSGYSERELQILLDREKMASYGTGITEVVTALSTRLRNIPAGLLEGENETALVRVIARSGDPKEISDLIVRSNDSGVAVRVGQVARVVDSAKKPTVLVRVNGEPSTLMVVTKAEEADSVSVVDRVIANIQTFEKTLPQDYRILIYNDEGTRVKDRLAIVQFNAIAGLIAVLVILFFFLPGKVGLFSAASLPICALGTIAVMVYLDANFNIITMIALVICLGNLVDNSVVVSEYYTTLREKGKNAQEAAVEAAQQFWIPFTASTVTIVAAFLPMLVTKGVLGQFIRWIPIVVTIALILSLIESLSLLPARLQFLDPKVKKNEGPSFFTRIENGFGSFVAWTLRIRYFTAFGLTALIISGFVVTALFNRFELFPAEGVEYYIARFDGPPQMPLSITDKYSAELTEKVRAALGDDKIASIVARAGVQQAGVGDPLAKTGENVGFLLIRIRKEVYQTLRAPDALAALRTVPKPEGLQRLVFESLAGGPPVGRPLTVTLRSTDPIELKREAAELFAEIEKIPGVTNVETDQVETGTEYQFLPNDAVTSVVGLTADTLGLNLRAAIEGFQVATLTDRGLEYDVTVRYSAPDKQDVTALTGTKVLNSRGSLTPLSSLGQIKSEKAPPVVKGFNFKRSITFTADVDNVLATSTSANMKTKEILARTLKDAPKTSTIFGGQEESTKESLVSLGIALVLAIFGIFATLVFTFRSFGKPIVILSTIPLGLVGVFYSFAIDQRPLSFLAFIGVVGLSGVVINSAIILVDFIEELRRDKPDTPITEILVEASRLRLRAVLATGLTTVVGLLPTAFGIGGNDPLLVPITLALSWGMIIGTVLSLVWIPSFYVILEELMSAIGRLKKRAFSFRT